MPNYLVQSGTIEPAKEAEDEDSNIEQGIMNVEG